MIIYWSLIKHQYYKRVSKKSNHIKQFNFSTLTIFNKHIYYFENYIVIFYRDSTHISKTTVKKLTLSVRLS